MRICLLGASFDTGNMGVSALAESSVKCILARWPDAQVTLLGSGRQEGEYHLRLADRDVLLRRMPIRFCRNVLLPHHFGLLFFYAVALRLLPLGAVKRFVIQRNPCLRLLLETDYFVDIAGGDSFSDIYGSWRLLQGFLVRLLPLTLRKDLILLPQTYGPFKRTVSRCLARYILRRSRAIYSRDHAGLAYVQGLLGRGAGDERVRLIPDVAFVLDPRQPPEGELAGLEGLSAGTSAVVGLNVSGLIYYGGYTGGNEFGLKVDYRALVDRIADLLLRGKDAVLLLVPHVIPGSDYAGNVENDLKACLSVYERLAGRYPGRVFVARGRYDHSQIKYLIGMCDFFVGTRMHSCIAALSQCIPAVGLAYSRKFEGVFETVGVGELALDMRSVDEEGIVAAVGEAFASRYATAERLRQTIPPVQRQVMTLLQSVDS